MTTLPTRALGLSTLKLTPIGLGAWAIGGEWRFGWGPQDDAAIDRDDSSRHRARSQLDRHGSRVRRWPLRRGCRQGAARHSAQRAAVRVYEVQPGVGRRGNRIAQPPGRNRSAGEVEQSLRRLQTERIDLYQIHWPVWPASPQGHDPGTIEEAWTTLTKLRDEGKAAFIGVSNFDVAQLQRISRIETPTNLQPPYSMLRPEIEQEILPFCLAHNIGVIPYSPMQSGLLTGTMTRERIASLPEGDWRRNNRFYQEPMLSRAFSLVESPACDWREARPHAGRGGDCLDAAPSGDHCHHRRRAEAAAD